MIKFSKSNISQKTLIDVKNVLKNGWLTHGKFSQNFENEFKKYTKSKYCTIVSSCTAALHISCLALGFKKGDEVIVTAMSHTATSHAVEYTGAKVIFADINFSTGNIDPDNIKKLINKKTKALIIVHMAGKSCEMKKIVEICNKKKIKIIEDCAHALGTKFEKKHVGNFGISGCFSFYPTKQLTTGEGGALITNNSSFYRKVKMLKAFGIDKDITERKNPGEYDVKYLGFNYRMTDFQAAMGYNQLKNYNKNLKRRLEIAKRYIKRLKDIKKIFIPEFSKNDSYFVFQIFLNTKKIKFDLMKKFKEKNIGISVHYGTPLPSMTYYKKKYNYKLYQYKNSFNYAQKVISLPVYPKLKNNEIDLICKYIKESI